MVELRAEDASGLLHFGVKGMKWGVRKEERKAATANLKLHEAEVNRRYNTRRDTTTITKEAFKKLDDKDVVVERGAQLARISKNPNDASSSNPLYVSTNKQDATNYRATAPTWDSPTGLPARSYKGYYETTFEATTKLKSPSEKERVQGYIKLMDQKSVRLENGETITGKEYLSRQGLGNVVQKLSSRDVALTYYGQLVAIQGIRNDPLNTAYFNTLKAKGYNALIDDNDRGILAKSPTLIFNARDDLRTLTVQQLTTSDIHRAQASLRLPD